MRWKAPEPELPIGVLDRQRAIGHCACVKRRAVVVGAVVVAVSAALFVATSDGLGSNDHRHGNHPVFAPKSVAETKATHSTVTTACPKPATTPVSPNVFIQGRLRAPVKLQAGQVLASPPRDGDTATISAGMALHPTDSTGHRITVSFPGVTPVIVLTRFTDAISVARQDHWVDLLAWIVVFNDVLLYPRGPGPIDAPTPCPFRGYHFVLVDAASGLALSEYESGPPLTSAQLGV